MGRCNNRRTQERAAQERNVPSRARFSKGPPKRNAGRGGGGRDNNINNNGRGGGRGGRSGRSGRSAANEAVVQKLQDRAKQQRRDTGGISIASSQQQATASTNNVAKMTRHPLDGIDVSKLDVITLSPESIAIVERLLKAYDVWDGDVVGDDDFGEDEENNIDVVDEPENVDASDWTETVDEHTRDYDASDSIPMMQEKTERQQSYNHLEEHLFALLHGDDTYDDYCGDYDDEPDYKCSRDIDINDRAKRNFMDGVYKTDGDESDEDMDSCDHDDDYDQLKSNEDQNLMETPLFRHLTQHYSFEQHNVIQALKASHKRLLSKKIDSKLGDKSAAEDEGVMLEMAIDWLSLHVDENDLRSGFRVQAPSKQSSAKSFDQSKGLNNHPGWNQTIKAVPHESISIMPKLTESQYKKETKEAFSKWKSQQLSTELVRMGFHFNEVESVMSSFKAELDEVFGRQNEEDATALQPSSVLDGALFKNLIESVQSTYPIPPLCDKDLQNEMEEAALIERDQEREVLEAIYAEGFKVNTLNDACGDSGCEFANRRHHHYEIILRATALMPPARSDMSHLHVLTRAGYPLTSPPSLWFTNPTLPPTMLRRISTRVQIRARELIGQAAVYDLVEYLTENLSSWQEEYTDEEAQIEQCEENNVKTSKIDVIVEDNADEIDYYTATFTAEEIKKLSRRQRQKLRAAEKSHVRDAILLEKQRVKEQKDEERRERIRLEDSTVSSRRAEQVVERRWKEWVQEEAEKAARKAMNAAFLRDESREQAREAAEIARVEVLKFHGEIDECCGSSMGKATDLTSGKNLDQQIGPMNKEGLVTTDDEVAQHEQSESTSPAASVAAATTNSLSGTTAKTLAFTEKLRMMYEQKAKEKAAGISEEGQGGEEKNNLFESIHLSDAISVINAKTHDSTSPDRVPAPVVVSSPSIDNILQDILRTQRDQPWLVHPDARIATVVPDDDCRIQNLSGATASKKDKISNLLRKELEKKYTRSQGQSGKERSQTGVTDKFHEMLSSRSKLPAYKMRSEVLETIRTSQVTVVSGDTGCGKTTQVPQLVLDDLILKNRGADANIIVTQPRRISAIGVSERIAAERCERLGETVGYSIRLESKRSSKTRLLLCTTGVLIRRLQVDPDLAAVSHVFVDEVHERDLNTDFLLIILKDLLRRRPSLKLVLMSATLNADIFSQWFGCCPIAQPVKEFRLEDALQVTGHSILEQSDCARRNKPGDSTDANPSKTSLRRLYPNYSKNVIDSLAIVDESVINYDLIADLLQYICRYLEDGAILVFLPGLKEITTAKEALSKLDYFRDSNAMIYPLHSSLSNADQTAIFQRPPNGKRKIVLSTNIAETSITIDDVVFVVDTGRVKENRYDNLNKMPTLVECWVSKASAKQRKGRAGRVKPGYCWHLYSSHTHDKEIHDYQLPEMLRVGLEDLVLQILVLDLGEPSIFLKKAINPPSDLAIKNALELLESLGAVECKWHDQDQIVPSMANNCKLNVATSLTALGYHLAALPVHPRAGKMMVYGALFGLFDSCLTIAAAMTSRSPFISSFENRDAASLAKSGFASDDHISVLLAFNQWRDLRQKDGRQARNFLRENFLSYASLSNMLQLRKQLEKYMLDIGFSFPVGSSDLISVDSNDMHLLRAVIAAGLYPNIIVAPKVFSGKTAGEVAFRGRKGDVYLHPCTSAFSAHKLDSRYCCYHEIVKTSKVFVRDCAAVSKFALLLFGGALKVYQNHGIVAVDEWLKFRIQAKPATLVKYLRNTIEALLLEKIMNPKLDVSGTSKGMAVIGAVSALLKMESI
eukprot:CCRYP_020114-RE/>CCRYP_020114-RE protein AED:0.18 eAED:0.18 QI:30/0.83/0.71/1/0.83/0.85/7/67/1794